jgi:putative membrane protein
MTLHRTTAPADAAPAARRREPLVLLVLAAVALGLSAIRPHAYGTWLLEVLAVLIAAPVLILTYRRFPLSPLAYRLIFAQAVILMIGGHWTYAEVPAGEWVQDRLGLDRNPYDRLGHLFQGITPAIVAREILLRRTPLRPGGWLFAIVVCVVLGVSACWEFFEWWSALIGGAAADDFLGAQGDVWDTQWDMFLAMCGAVGSQLVFARAHDRQLARLTR